MSGLLLFFTHAGATQPWGWSSQDGTTFRYFMNERKPVTVAVDKQVAVGKPQTNLYLCALQESA